MLRPQLPLPTLLATQGRHHRLAVLCALHGFAADAGVDAQLPCHCLDGLPLDPSFMHRGYIDIFAVQSWHAWKWMRWE